MQRPSGLSRGRQRPQSHVFRPFGVRCSFVFVVASLGIWNVGMLIHRAGQGDKTDDALTNALIGFEPLTGKSVALQSAAETKGTPEQQLTRTAESVSPTPMLMPMPAIPRIMLFTHKHNVLTTRNPTKVFKNVVNTIRLYGKAWGQHLPKVMFLDDEGCREAISSAEPRLLPHFDSETQGKFKADLCRVAALHESGGYYFDVDLRAVNPVMLSNETTFATVLDLFGHNLFQAFLAASPRHPILTEALRTMLGYYENPVELEGENIGPSTLRDAYDSVLTRSSASNTSFRILNEVNLVKQPDWRLKQLMGQKQNWELYPELPRQKGKGCCCNSVVHDPSEGKVYFFSRIPGFSDYCMEEKT